MLIQLVRANNPQLNYEFHIIEREITYQGLHEIISTLCDEHPTYVGVATFNILIRS